MEAQQSLIIFLLEPMASVLNQIAPSVWSESEQQEGGAVAGGLLKEEEYGCREQVYLNWKVQVLPYAIEVIKEFSLKYLDCASDQIIEHLLRKMSKVEGRICKTSGIRELVAAVVYCQYSGLIRLNLKDFSQMNHLRRKLFNKKYVAYQTIIKKEANRHTPCKQHELEQKPEENPKQEEQSNGAKEEMRVGSKREAIQLIYDGIFKSIYFQDHRREIIEKMASRCQDIEEELFDQMTWTDNQTLKLYYAIYVHLKSIGIELNFTKYREAVHHFAGLTIKRSHAITAAKIYKKITSSERQSSTGQNSSS